ncbi:hypothetical protein CAPTEDRAFT_221536 [Capitella teleta]|uniref:Direct IAP-binding protein with low pI n=1 Tax=Capitella teleta TaxID=283909 RepID=R7T7S3_CAPTE|nr:hypothetical protein CAPTEDRAFT_221536 [Capitella teleta]|eukprot:ELT89699.1 hypothetical protein CAPTEDRAFT_221536 [Capitella teleta]
MDASYPLLVVLELIPPNPQDLTSTYLIKNASVATVDAGSALLTQIACSLLEAYQQYQLALVEVIKLLELNLTVIGEESKEDALWDVLLQIRADVSYWKTEKEDLEAAFSCAERSLEAAAEAAHIAGATYAGMAASERLFSAKARLREARDKVEESESVLRKLEVETIEKTIDHQKKEEAKKVAARKENTVIEEELTQDESDHSPS